MAANKPLFIVDASVVLKWFLEENDDKAEAMTLGESYLNKDIEFEMLDYTIAEIFNTMVLKLDRKKALSALSHLFTFNILQCNVTLEIASQAAELMGKYKGISFYDAGYHALAKLEDGTFITADEKYYKKTHKEGNIMLLKNYGKKR